MIWVFLESALSKGNNTTETKTLNINMLAPLNLLQNMATWLVRCIDTHLLVWEEDAPTSWHTRCLLVCTPLHTGTPHHYTLRSRAVS